jgi:hypothetical protein
MANFDSVRVVVGFGMANNTNRNRIAGQSAKVAPGCNQIASHNTKPSLDRPPESNPVRPSSHMAPPPPPQLVEELVEEILLRLPPDDSASLVRAALVCRLFMW